MSQPLKPSVQELASSFQAFTKVSEELEHAYECLRNQAAKIDTALADSNRLLQEKVHQLDETSRHLHAVLGTMQPALVVTDPAGRITLANRAFEELVGETMESLRLRLKNSLRDPAGQPICDPAPGSTSTLRCLQRPDGNAILVRSSLSPMAGSTGAPEGEVETLVDETEREQLRDQLRRQETLSALGEMAAGIAHELRNPMQAAEGFAHLLCRRLSSDDDCMAHAQRIISGIRKANSIITNLLCFARPDSFRPRRCTLQPLLTALKRSYQLDDNNSIQLTINPVTPPSLALHCHPALIERLLVNLIENARTALSGAGRILVTAATQGNEVLLRVADSGPGIPPELRPRLFLPFVTGRPEGTGLGLAIVHRIVDLHQGTIEVGTSSLGGALFSVRLPRAKQSNRHRNLAASAPESSVTDPLRSEAS
jgi:signal transduction histidine kinase